MLQFFNTIWIIIIHVFSEQFVKLIICDNLFNAETFVIVYIEINVKAAEVHTLYHMVRL